MKRYAAAGTAKPRPIKDPMPDNNAL
jgi:hypothetical protein